MPPVDPATIDAAHAELIALRGEFGRFTTAKLSNYPLLVQLCGEGELIEAYLALRRELERHRRGTKFESAAALSIIGAADTVLDRLAMAAECFDDQDQRTLRRWSDRGLKRIAEDLVAIANVRGRLGRELLTLTLEDSPKGGLQLIIDQMDFADLPSQPPTVSLWIWKDDDTAEEATIDLPEEQARSAENQIYRNTRWRIAIPDVTTLLADENRHTATTKLLTIAIHGRTAPARTVTWANTATLPTQVAVEVTLHRTMVLVEFTVRSL